MKKLVAILFLFILFPVFAFARPLSLQEKREIKLEVDKDMGRAIDLTTFFKQASRLKTSVPILTTDSGAVVTINSGGGYFFIVGKVVIFLVQANITIDNSAAIADATLLKITTPTAIQISPGMGGIGAGAFANLTIAAEPTNAPSSSQAVYFSQFSVFASAGDPPVTHNLSTFFIYQNGE